MDLAEEDEDRRAHRHDMHPALLACDPMWTPDPRGNRLFAELVSAYNFDAARCLWELAAEWHRCELAAELSARSLRGAA